MPSRRIKGNRHPEQVKISPVSAAQFICAVQRGQRMLIPPIEVWLEIDNGLKVIMRAAFQNEAACDRRMCVRTATF
jgi:hypothetical protein